MFSGCGGVSEGLKQAGVKVVAAVEIDPIAADTYLANHPGTLVRVDDIRAVSPSEFFDVLSIAPGRLDLLTACAPCQGFSRLRTLNGSASIGDERNDLILSVMPFVEAALPKSLMLENVPALRYAKQMDAVRASLQRLGYRFLESIIDVADHGVAQHRRRYILVASRAGGPAFPAPRDSYVTVRDAIGGLAIASDSTDQLHSIAAKHSERVRRLIADIPKDGGSRRDLPRSRQLPCHRRSDGFSDVYGRMAWDRPSPTITSGFVNPSRGRFLHPELNRAISLREGALLQSFPPDYRFSLSRGKYETARVIGNAVPPEFVRRQATALFPTD